LKKVLNLASAFADWIKKNFEAFKDAVEHVAQVFANVFSDVGQDAVKELMKGIGFAESAIEDAIKTVYGKLEEACAITRAALAM
jgi:phage-related protein